MDVQDPALWKADLIMTAAKERKAFDLTLLKVDQMSSLTDYFFICSCRSSRQAKAVAEHIMGYVKARGGYQPLGVEGLAQGHWILIDFGEVITHVFYTPYRDFYDLEGLWIEAARIDTNLSLSPKEGPTEPETGVSPDVSA